MKTMKFLATMLVLSLLVGGIGVWAPVPAAIAQTTTAANKIGIAASDVQIINQTQKPNDQQTMNVDLFSTTFKTSTTEDLIIQVNAECGLYTAVGAKGNYDLFNPSATPLNTSSTAMGQVQVWLELDGKALPTTLTSPYRFGDPNADPPTTGNGPVVFCNRAFNLSTQNLLAPQLITLFEKTRQANAYQWFATNVGNGTHTLKVKATLVASTESLGNDGSVTVTYVTPAASAIIGQRTMTVEPVHLMNSASF